MHAIALSIVAAVLSTVISPSCFSEPALVTQTSIQVAPFSSVELRNGGKVRILHGPTQSVKIVKGNTANSGLTVNYDGGMVIDRCQHQCPRGYELEVEIVTPVLAKISIAEGGLIQVSGNFMRQPTILLAVNQGGTIDIRSMSVDNVSASVNEGGTILSKPQTAITARVVNGGNITYWGEAQIKSSIRGGGVVVKGADQEANKPLSEFDTPVHSVPPVAPVAPIRPPQ